MSKGGHVVEIVAPGGGSENGYRLEVWRQS
jgi:hypothetical protein